MTTHPVTRWTPQPSDDGILIDHFHADGDAHHTRHTHRLPAPDHPHIHGTHSLEPVDTITLYGLSRENNLILTRSQNGEVKLRITNPAYMLGLIVDSLAEAVASDLEIRDMPADPDEAAEWVRENLRPLTSVTLTLAVGAELAPAAAAIIPVGKP